MNATTEEQRREICEKLLEIWNGAIEEAGQMSLATLLRSQHVLTDTALLQHLEACYLLGLSDWDHFDEAALHREKFPPRREVWDQIADTYKLNAADRQHVRALIESGYSADAKRVTLERFLRLELEKLGEFWLQTGDAAKVAGERGDHPAKSA